MASKTIQVNELVKLRGWFLSLGILFVLFGFALMVLPAIGTITMDLLFGMILLVLGISEIGFAFAGRRWSVFFMFLFGGILSAGCGLFLLFNPIAGILTLTLILGVFLLAQGFVKTVRAFMLKANENWGWLLFDGLITIFLGLLITFGWPSDAAWVIGLLFGINLLFGGLSLISLSQAGK